MRRPRDRSLSLSLSYIPLNRDRAGWQGGAGSGRPLAAAINRGVCSRIQLVDPFYTEDALWRVPMLAALRTRRTKSAFRLVRPRTLPRRSILELQAHAPDTAVALCACLGS